jgi:hypothetical protein
MSQPRGYTCLAELAPLIIEIQRSADGLWTMHLFDSRAHARVILPPSEFDLDAAKQKAITNAEFYMRKHGGDPSWTRPATVGWREFTPRDVIWET